MGKTKGPKRRKLTAGPRKPADNPFEILESNKKFDVLGRKKDKAKNRLKLRGDATELRKKTLLVEYKQLRKSNAFIDRRFGEGDDTISAEEKALARLQKQRAHELAGNKFALPEEGEDIELTHLGKSLAEAEGLGQGWDDDMNDPYMRQLDNLYHFGGGKYESDELFQLKQGGEEGETGEQDQERRKSKAEVMAELISKSKAFRAAKQVQRENDTNEVDALDTLFRTLQSEGAFGGTMRRGGDRNRDGQAAEAEGDAAFDRAARELAFEAKGSATDRLKTQEELEAEEQERALKAERAQKLRARLGVTEEDEDELERVTAELEMPKGGYAARRARREATEAQLKRKRGISGDALEDEDDFIAGGSDEGDDFSDENEEAQLTGLEARQRMRASGEHPLRDSFRETATKLLKRHLGKENSDEEEEEEEDGSDEDAVLVSEEEVEEDDEEQQEEEQEIGVWSSSASEDEEELKEELEEEEEEEKDQDDEDLVTSSVDAAQKQGAPSGMDPEGLPTTYAAFEACVTGLSPEELRSYVGKLRAVHASRLAQGNRSGMQLFYGVLMQHFASVAAKGGAAAQALLDALLPHLLALTPAVPYYAATLARARLQRWSDRLTEALTDPLTAVDAWPAPGTLSVLGLFLTLFPVLDRRHPVLTPLSILLGRWLTYCPVTRSQHVAMGLALAGLLSAVHAPAQRYSPEPLRFATRCLSSITAANKFGKNDSSTKAVDENDSVDDSDDNQAELAEDTWLRGDSLADSLAVGTTFSPPSLSAFAANLDPQRWETAEGRTVLACMAAGQVVRSAASLEGCDAAPEVLEPARSAVERIVNSKEPLPPALLEEARAALEAVQTRIESVRRTRKPMVLAALLKIEEGKQFNPRFEEGYVAGKDYDPDRERAERRRLQRALRKEQRGAARELRKDSAFMAGVRDREKSTKQAALYKSERRAISILEKQESDYRSGGQGGMWKKGKEKLKR